MARKKARRAAVSSAQPDSTPPVVDSVTAEGVARQEAPSLPLVGIAASDSLRIRPCRDLANKVDGAVLVLADVDKLKLTVTERQRAQEPLRRLHEELELRVADRTAELARANQALQTEIVDHRRAEAARQELRRRLVSAQEDERQRLARELRDQLGQHVTALMLGLQTLHDASSREPSGRDRVRALLELTNQLGREVHRIAWELRPTALDDLGLDSALGNYVEEWSRRSNIAADLQTIGLDTERLPPHVNPTIYRIVQEALTNVLKHAQARHVSLILNRQGHEVLAIVEDDGRGFDAEAVLKSFGAGCTMGLLGMQERAALVGGVVEIESSHGQGTTLFVRIPLPPKEQEATHG